MKLQKFDIGAEIISILTKGMYPNPYDAVREYIQNAIDAKAKNVSVKVRNNTLVIEDDGSGMNHDILRKALRIGVSDKRPGKDVGFMGIGIYSAYHLCDKLEIISRGDNDMPNKLTMNFGDMKALLIQQKEQRLKNEISGNDLIDLQSLLEDYIEITEDNEIPTTDFPEQGTRIKLSDIDPIFYSELSKFNDLADYLREVIPLHFDKKNFTWGAKIETEIIRICDEKNAHFEIINLELQVEARIETLYRPYKDIDFNKQGKSPQEPRFYPIKDADTFWGVAWGCLNDIRKVVTTENIRGFILKKQGFSIGNRENMVKYFPQLHTFFDRYVGEIIVTNERLLPTASRNDFEFSVLRTRFFEALQEVTAKFDEEGGNFQEWTKADEEVAKNTESLKKFNANYNLAKNAEALVSLISEVKNLSSNIEKRIKRKAFSPDKENYFATKTKVEELSEQVKILETSIQDKINSLIDHKKQTKEDREKSLKITQNIQKLNPPKIEENKYESILDLLEDLDIEPNEKLQTILEILDEKYIETFAKTKTMYYQILNDLKTEIQQRLETL